VGTIRWPLRLQEEAAFHNYANDPIQTALYDAFSTIFNILVGATPHRLAQLFDEYVQKARKKFEATHRRRASDEDLRGLAQHFSFPVPCLPGDESLIDDFFPPCHPTRVLAQTTQKRLRHLSASEAKTSLSDLDVA